MPSFIHKPRDFLAGLLFLVVGVGAFVVAQDYSFGTARRMGSGYFPTVLAGILAALGAILILLSLFGRRDASEALALRPVLVVISGSLAFAFLLRPAGLVIAMITMVLIAAIGSRTAKLLPSLLLAGGLAAGSVVVFVWALGQPLPVWGSWFGS